MAQQRDYSYFEPKLPDVEPTPLPSSALANLAPTSTPSLNSPAMVVPRGGTATPLQTVGQGPQVQTQTFQENPRTYDWGPSIGPQPSAAANQGGKDIAGWPDAGVLSYGPIGNTGFGTENPQGTLTSNVPTYWGPGLSNIPVVGTPWYDANTGKALPPPSMLGGTNRGGENYGSYGLFGGFNNTGFAGTSPSPVSNFAQAQAYYGGSGEGSGGGYVPGMGYPVYEVH